jgi:hypothetical protein
MIAAAEALLRPYLEEGAEPRDEATVNASLLLRNAYRNLYGLAARLQNDVMAIRRQLTEAPHG